jgi:hypothetical protein
MVLCPNLVPPFPRHKIITGCGGSAIDGKYVKSPLGLLAGRLGNGVAVSYRQQAGMI